MAGFNTPSEKSAVSSVFMTPSSSCGRPVLHPPKSLLTPLPLSFPSPAHTPLLSRPVREEHKDILTDLFEAGLPLVAKKILLLLEKEDIARCLRVCKSWKHHISEWCPPPPPPHKPSPPSEFIDENTLSHSDIKSLSLRAPLATINNAPKRQDSPKKRKREDVCGGPSHMRPCPQCQSPAKRLNLRRSECTKCHFDFCEHCFSLWHEESCAGRNMPASPKKRQDCVSVAGTKKSKKRLKRL